MGKALQDWFEVIGSCCFCRLTVGWDMFVLAYKNVLQPSMVSILEDVYNIYTSIAFNLCLTINQDSDILADILKRVRMLLGRSI